MQLRNTLIIVGATLAILAPTATARIAPDPLDDGPGTAQASTPHNYAGLVKTTSASVRASRATTGPLTENSNGASLPQTRPVSSKTSHTAAAIKRLSPKSSIRVVAPRMVDIPSVSGNSEEGCLHGVEDCR